jgi:hypothetical protein
MNLVSTNLRRLSVLAAVFALSMMLTPTSFAQRNLQIRAPKFEVTPASYTSVLAPQVDFISAVVERNVKGDGINGLEIQINFTVKDANCSSPCRITAYFYNDDDDTELEASYPAYRTTTGKVAITDMFTPDVNPEQYENYRLWIPYRALNLDQTSGNEFHLRFRLEVMDGRKKTIGISDFYPFTLKFN